MTFFANILHTRNRFWSLLFTLMKLLEFGDAVFIVTKTTTDIFTLVPSYNELFFYIWFSDIKTRESNSWFNLVSDFIFITFLNLFL